MAKNKTYARGKQDSQVSEGLSKRNTMSDSELVSILSTAEADCVINQSKFAQSQKDLIDAYNGKLYGNEVEGKSKVVSRDVQNIVDSDMTSLAEIFLGVDKPIKFKPVRRTPRTTLEAQEKNALVNHVIFDSPGSYQTLHSWMKSAEMQSCSAIKYFMEETVQTEEHQYNDLSEDEITELMLEFEEDFDEVILVAKIERDGVDNESNAEVLDTSFDVKFRTVVRRNEVKLATVPTEQFLISSNASCLDEAELVGDKSLKTRGQLLAEGYDPDIVGMLATSDSNDENDSVKQARDSRTGYNRNNGIQQKPNDLIPVDDYYVMLDYDGDGIPERRRIVRSGNHILLNEAFNHVPYATLSCILMPEKVVGKSRAELCIETQKVKTALTRQMLDNGYMVNNPRHVVHPDINLEDMLDVRQGGIVRLKSGSQVAPQGAVAALNTEYIGDKSLLLLQYMEQQLASQAGTLMQSQGLNADSFSKETAARFKGIQEAGVAKIKLVARNFAETGYRKLYEGVAWLLTHFQNKEMEIEVLGKEMTIDPSEWKYPMSTVATVGLGAGKLDNTEALSNVITLQRELQNTGSPLVDQTKVYNAIKDTMYSMGVKDVSNYFNNPEVPEDLVMAQNEALQAQVMQMQQIIESLQQAEIARNQLAEAERVKAEGILLKQQGDLQLQAAELQSKERMHNADIILATEKANNEERKVNADIIMKQEAMNMKQREVNANILLKQEEVNLKSRSQDLNEEEFIQNASMDIVQTELEYNKDINNSGNIGDM